MQQADRSDVDESLRLPAIVAATAMAMAPTAKTPTLRHGHYDREVARMEARELAEDRAREIDMLSSLSQAARRARRAADLRRCVAGDASHVRRSHAAAERRAQALRAGVRASLHGVRRRSPRRAARAHRAQSGTRVSTGTAGDADPAPAPRWKAKSKSEQAVILVKTRNKKLGLGAWASTLPVHQTCSTTCPFLDNGCYAQRGPGGHVARLEANAQRDNMTALDLAHEEARLIRHFALVVPRGTPLRLHVSGDSASPEAAQIVSAACEEWPGPVWTYTHADRAVPREAWGRVSILASIERPEDAASAMERGYAPALVVAEHPEDGDRWHAGGVTWIPCPSEVDEDKTCSNCGLCFNAKGLLRRREGIAFSAHGSGAGRVRDTLIQLRKKGAVSQ